MFGVRSHAPVTIFHLCAGGGTGARLAPLVRRTMRSARCHGGAVVAMLHTRVVVKEEGRNQPREVVHGPREVALQRLTAVGGWRGGRRGGAGGKVMALVIKGWTEAKCTRG